MSVKLANLHTNLPVSALMSSAFLPSPLLAASQENYGLNVWFQLKQAHLHQRDFARTFRQHLLFPASPAHTISHFLHSSKFHIFMCSTSFSPLHTPSNLPSTSFIYYIYMMPICTMRSQWNLFHSSILFSQQPCEIGQVENTSLSEFPQHNETLTTETLNHHSMLAYMGQLLLNSSNQPGKVSHVV